MPNATSLMRTGRPAAPSFLLAGHAGFHNRGCEAIVRATIALLRGRWPGCGVTLASQTPEPDRSHPAASGISIVAHRRREERWSAAWLRGHLQRRVLQSPAAADRALLRNLAPATERATAILSIGGDNYGDDYGGPGWLLALHRMAGDARRPIIVWGASIGPFQDAAVHQAVMESLRRSALITARESLTVEDLAQHGVSANVRRVADPAFLLEPSPVDTTAYWPKGDRVLGLNVSPLLRRYQAGGADDPIARMALECIRAALRDHDLGVLLIPHVMPPEGGGDHAYMAALARELNEPERVRLAPSNLHAPALKHVISRCDLLMAARTHATIAGFSSAVPTISLAYSRKALGINRDLFGDERWAIDARRMASPGEAVARLAELVAMADGVRSHLAARAPEMVALARSAVDHLAEVLETR